LSDVAKLKAASINDVVEYADNMKQYYKHQTIVAIHWPPKIGNDFFGRLALVEKQNSSTQNVSAWHLLRGQVDKSVKLTRNETISYKDLFHSTDCSLPLRIVIDGPPGIGKTTLCYELLSMWSKETLVHQQHDFKLVLYCPLRSSKIARATTLADLFMHPLNEYKNVPEWFEKRDGKGLLIIFDGWDELKMDNLSRHVQVIGFSEKEISTVIIQILQKDQKLAKELIAETAKYYSHFKTIQSSKDSQLAVKLINDLKFIVRKEDTYQQHSLNCMRTLSYKPSEGMLKDMILDHIL
uniref:NACHT domain-containing protein n=1 Tax=Amphimedon queenslandica TaxID=400682 RepID=A0A1X7TGX8_AMPQE